MGRCIVAERWKPRKGVHRHSLDPTVRVKGWLYSFELISSAYNEELTMNNYKSNDKSVIYIIRVAS